MAQQAKLAAVPEEGQAVHQRVVIEKGCHAAAAFAADGGPAWSRTVLATHKKSESKPAPKNTILPTQTHGASVVV